MTDEELGEELAPDETPERRTRLVAALTPERRATLERMIGIAAEINAGNIPEGVIVCRERRQRK